MKKITNLIVKGRYVFLTLFILIAGFSLYLSTKVNINEDIMKYLPKTSETKIGKDIMDKEFSEQDSSNLNVMFKNLSEQEKEDTLKKLESIDGVSSVEYENTEEYNNGKYTLYVLNVDDYDHSVTSTNVYNYVSKHFKVSGMNGSIYEENKPILPLWIIFLAIISAMIILTILSESYVEPWLYLISIGIAVFINKGTNIMFESVSSITNSIVAILQLALSMDYSIILSNRYKQEKKVHKNKVEAMKEALYHSFISISSSSVTTIVGLIALVFMSFSIGRDLGLVLAKGVLLSLISIFFCLPGLLLIFDDLVGKTKKKAPKFNLTKLGNYIYKTRYIQSAFIIILFIVAYLLKGSIGILYTGSEQDKVAKFFPTTNQVAIVYNNKYENFITDYCKKLEKDKKIDEVLCYSNTINEKLAYNELNKKIKDLGEDTQIENYLIKLIYYKYYNQSENNKISLNDFVSFIKSDVYNNEDLNDSIDEETKNNLKLLENFTSKSLINKKRTSKEISNILGMNEEDAESILIYYNSKNLKTKMTIKDFIDFILNDISKDPKYSKNLDSTTISNLKQLQTFTNLNIANKEMSSNELSNIFGIDEDLINELFLFYRVNSESNTKLTLNEFSTFALKLSEQDSYKDMFNNDIKRDLMLLNTLSNEEVINKKLNIDDMKKSLSNIGINLTKEKLTSLYTYYTGYNTETKLTLNEFASTALSLVSKEEYKKYFNDEVVYSLNMIKQLTSNYDKVLSQEKLYDLFNIDNLYRSLLNGIITEPMTPVMFVDTLLNNKMIAGFLSNDQMQSLNKAKYIMSNVNTLYSVNELTNRLDQDKTIVSMVYGVYDVSNGNIKDISIKQLINFLVNNKSNPLLSSYIELMEENINFAYAIVNNTSTKYNYKEISKLTNTDSSLIKQVYGLYDYNNKKTTLTPYELIKLILNNKDNELLEGKLSKESINKLITLKKVISNTINKEKITSTKISKILNIDNEMSSLICSLYNSKYIKSNQTISLKNYVNFIIKDVMNNSEYKDSFDNVKKQKLNTINKIMNNSLNNIKYDKDENYNMLNILSDNTVDKNLVDLVYIYYGSKKEYDKSWKMTIEEFVNYLNEDIVKDKRFDKFIDEERKDTITDSKENVDKSKKLIVSDKYSRAVLNTTYDLESDETYKFINSIYDEIDDKNDIYVVGNSSMAVEMDKTFNKELNKITILTMLFIFVVVALTFKDLIIPFVLVLIIQTAVYLIMSIISVTGGSVYFISLLIVQAILMGATIDYAIVYTSYYRESRLTMNVKDSIINAYNKSINTIISSSLILIIVTLIVACFASQIAAKICETISEGTLASVILILAVLPGVLAGFDKLICRKGYYKK